jgi:hypothetical protein
MSPNHVALPSMIDNWAAPAAAGQQRSNSIHYGSTPPSQLARELTKKLSNSPRKSILPRPSMRFQPDHVRHGPLTPVKESPKKDSSSNLRRKKRTMTTPVHVGGPQEAQIPLAPRQPNEIEDADAFLSFVHSVNNRSPDDNTTN